MGLPFFYGVRGTRAIYFGVLNDQYSWTVNGLVVMAWIIGAGLIAVALKHRSLLQSQNKSIRALEGMSAASGFGMVVPVS